MDIRKIERPKVGILVEDPGRRNIIIFPFQGPPNVDKNRPGGIRNTPIVLSNKEAWELRQALNKRVEEKGQI